MTKPFIQGQGEDFDNESKLPIHLKMLLTIREAAEYSNIGINKIDSMLKQPNCPFVLYVGTRKLVKRKEFETFIRENLIIEASNPVPTPLLGHRCRSSQEITGSPTPFSTSNHYLWICASASFSLSNPNIAA